MYAHLRMYVRTHKAVSDMSRSGITDQGPGIRPKEVNRMKKMKKTLANPLTKVQYRSSYSCNSGLRSFCEIGKAQPMIIMQAWKWEQLSELAKKGAKRIKTWCILMLWSVDCSSNSCSSCGFHNILTCIKLAGAAFSWLSKTFLCTLSRKI